jgi:hypothetical protein
VEQVVDALGARHAARRRPECLDLLGPVDRADQDHDPVPRLDRPEQHCQPTGLDR